MAASEQPFQLSEATNRAIRQCVHCGLCLPSCPTYRELGTEMDSPRGRIYLVRALEENRIDPDEDAGPDLNAINHLDLCLGCRACETACPSGVDYGEVIEGARAAAYETRLKRCSFASRTLEKFLLRKVLPSRRLLGAFIGLLNFYNKSGLRELFDDLIPNSLKPLAAKAPELMGKPFHKNSEAIYEAKGERRGRVCFFSGCVMDGIMGDIHRDTIKVLVTQGIEVVVPKTQVCCGALHIHEGDRVTAIALAQKNLRVLDQVDGEFDAFVNNSAGCGAHMQKWGHLLADDEQFAEFAAEISAKTMDVTRYLVDKGLLPFPNPYFAAAAYDAPCHLYHAQKETKAPMQLLGKIKKFRLVELPNSDQCCGAAGSYTLTQPEMSERIFMGKLEALQESKADLVVTGNPGCILQFRQGLARAGLDIEVKHPMQIAAAAAEV
ncbi:MAG TPA: 4Fe-4S ferredoxin [Lentisphaeria bacterium]|nr:4Fe-4S ferredoxin [Lentisphaeria bacterium]|tara:strand:+ start:2525 stop:3835 length:1311 start_codon:yes stop_codon:yes gene_type:complete